MDERAVGMIVAAGLGALFGPLAALLLALLSMRWRRAKRLMAAGGHAVGVVVRHRARAADESGRDLFAVVVEFRDGKGRLHELTSMRRSSHPAALGSRCEVAYDVRRPSRAILVDEARMMARVGVGVGALLATFALAGLAVSALIALDVL